jgi:uncharacterized protein with ATP-grasp and redox domains
VNSKPGQHLPPIIKTSDPDSFAAFTFKQRLPEMLDQIIVKNGLNRSEARGFEELKEQLHSGTVQLDLSDHPYLQEQMDGQEYETWSREIEKHTGRSWLDLPWYFAESLFYLEILLAWGYSRKDNPRFGMDPFQVFKEEELKRAGGGLDLGTRIAAQAGTLDTPEERLALLLRYGLWANRLDLSYSQLLERYRDAPQGESHALLLDHSETITEKLLRARRVDLILDNSASELTADLYLAYDLLRSSPGLKVVLHCKASPFYVSDAMIKDVAATISVMGRCREAGLRRAGRELSGKVKGGSLVLTDHSFWNGPLLFSQLPSELKRELGGSDLVVLKGDLNYRRLLRDRRWDPTTPMEGIVGYFPAALATLRTTKSELIVDCPRETFERLSREDPKWLVEGRYGIIRYCDPR